VAYLGNDVRVETLRSLVIEVRGTAT
jgi:hypothetical protein